MSVPRLQAVIGLSERFLERNQLISVGGKNTIEFWYITLITRADAFEKIRNELAPHGPCIDASISSMMSDVGMHWISKASRKRISMRHNLV